ncbi:hypothetical protein SD70_02545 [Gordoniibacillus kamchatkensis]|uniref:Mannosyl-glycoprotein endo-beta-N-acetylglucosamidase-like domain-containing protein n=1 Tax=Gordoniibacillus kamchatkensis TaxID=1590651 RepID=A0ABR5AMC1_9BACL|nr:glucosaminidase domain-containing protein [Paenibacillus sp. VKM B-2647]KIL42082.1 hypothetical protein SD70_02545 [Paenibacillus sp. VKM B-2647]
MADKQIGIKLDVKSTGLKQVDDALNSVSKSLKEMNGKVIDQQQKGWGSEAQTKELREQLRYMQQMLQLAERMARTRGIQSDKFSQYSREISSMQRDLAGVPTYQNPGSGWMHNRFGIGPASAFDRGMTYASRIGAGLVAFDLLSTLRSGISTGTQLSYGYGDLAKRMSPSGSALKYGINLSNSLQGYGYDDTALLQGATTYGGATGRMDSGQFQKQMLSILQTGRRFGLDLSPVVQNFAGMFQAGVTGGSNQQLSPQEYANLVANAVNRGNMQGREQQLLNQLSQVIQMGVSQSGQAGDIRQLGGLLTLINRSGNQGLISNAGTVIQGLNNMITSPGGGYAGQGLIIQALQRANPGMGYFQLMDLASQGLSNPTNLKSVMSSLSKYTKDKDQLAYLMSQMGGGNQHQLRQFLDSAMTPDGTFNQQAIDDFAKSALTPPAPVPQNDVDSARNRTQGETHAGNMAGQETLQGRSYIDSIQGGLLDHFGPAAVYGAEGLMALNMGYGAYKFGRKIFKRGGGPAGPTGPTAPTEPNIPRTSARPSTTPPRTPSLPGGNIPTSKAPLGGGASALSRMFEITALFSANDWADSAWDWMFGHSKGSYKMGHDPFHMEKWTDDRPSLWQRLTGKGNKTDESASNNPSNSSVVGSTVSLSGSTLAPIVASTIVALGPYMGQLKPYLAVDNTKGPQPMNDLVYRGQGFTANDLVYRGGGSGLQLVSMPMSGGGVAMRPAGAGGGSSAFTGSASSFVKKMLPYAQKASMRTGLPVEFILGQWGHESGWGTSQAAKMDLNFAGIKPWDGAAAGPDSTYAGYSSLSDFSDGYADFLIKNKRYKGLLDAARNGASDDELAKIMGNTGYAEDPDYASKLRGAIGTAQRSITVKGEVTINVKQPDGSTTQVKAPLSADYTGIAI